MLTSSFPFKYLAILSDSTLTTNIRERSWDLDKIFPQIKAAKSEIKELGKGIKSDSGSIFKLRQSIAALAAEIKAGFRDLKLINFYDSAIFYLYFRLLSHVLELCKKEESRLRSIKKAKIQIEEKIKEYEKLIKNFGAAKKSLIEDYEQMVKALEKRRWGLEKQAQHELGLLRITLRSMSNLNRKIKIEAAFHAARDENAFRLFLGEQLPVLGRDAQTIFVVEGVLEAADEEGHLHPPTFIHRFPLISHFLPLWT